MLSSLSTKYTNRENNNEINIERIRIPVKIIYKNKAMADALSLYLSSTKGINYSKANSITGKVLILYNDTIINEKTIEKQISKFSKNNIIKKKAIVIDFNHNHFKEEISNSLAFDDISQLSSEMPVLSDEKVWHNMNCSEIEKSLKANLKKGLNSDEISEKIKLNGLNLLNEKKRKSLLSTIKESFDDFSTRLLLGVSVISLFLGQIPDAIAILGIVIIETTFGVIQQYKSEKSIYSLKDMIVHKTRVLRNGKMHEIDAKYIVPGDIICVEAGDKVPADARIINSSNLMTMESSLTGESVPVSKNCDCCSEYTDLGDRYNMLYMGTNITCGRGKAIVISTGSNTQIGKIASMLQSINIEQTPLQRKMQKFINGLTKMCIGLCIGIIFIGLISGRGFGELLTIGVSISLGALPESLPAVVTIAMALSIQRIAKKKAIVRKLTAIETLGAANVICCDKTGTLTMNEMTVRNIYCDKSLYNVSGSGYSPSGEIGLINGDDIKNSTLNYLLEISVLCNNSELIKDENNKWDIQGDPTEGALVVAANKNRINVVEIRRNNIRLKEVPFDCEKRCMTVIIKTNDELYAYSKGSLTSIIEKCTTIFEDGEERLFTATDKKELYSINEDMADDALRTLAFAYKKLNNEEDNLNNGFVFLGIAGMEDPPKEGVKKAIQKCHTAGIKVVMITGDNKNTAAAIGTQLGLFTDGMIITGSELDDMSDEELDKRVGNIQIFARTSPEQKYRIVKSFKRFGYIVAMTGDGVNDAPAIKEANIGIAMGKNGSDIAKDVADITLLDDNFSTLVAAIEEGRAVANNIRNTMKYLLSGSLGEIITILLAGIATGTLPMISIQLLWVNVICESILGSSLAIESPGTDLMSKPPVIKDAPLIDRNLGTQIIRRGFGIGLSTFAIFEGSMLLGLTLVKARTLAFTTIIFAQLVNLYDSKNTDNKSNSKYMNTAALSSVAMLLSIIYIPYLNIFFGTVPLNIFNLASVYGITKLSRI